MPQTQTSTVQIEFVRFRVMKVLILCGGRGVIDPERRTRIPKSMLIIGNRPVLWHVMKSFAIFGHNEFVLALGEGGEEIRNYFLNYSLYSGDTEVALAGQKNQALNSVVTEDWKIKLVDTGLGAQTGSRIARCRRYIGDERFFVTYSDCLCSVNLDLLVRFHEKQRKLVTVTGVQPTSRFGTFFCEGDNVTRYSLDTKMSGIGGYVNGGFMLMESGVFGYVEPFNECNLEREVFEKLAIQKQVAVYPHGEYWHAVDTERDVILLNQQYNQNRRPWLPAPDSFKS